jgi:hypothetical protein
MNYISRFRAILILAAAFAATSASANYNANLVGVPLTVSTYEGGLVLFILDTQASAVGGTCSAVFFGIDPSIPADQRALMFARLQTAQAAGQSINVGYDNTGAAGCVDGYIHAYRIG